MPKDYTTLQLMHDVVATIQDNAPVVISVAIIVASANWVVGWFMDVMRYTGRSGRS